MYFIAKLQWLEPKENADDMVVKTKNHLLSAVSVTDAEATMVSWTPSNYQDAQVLEVKQSQISDITIIGESETFWEIKMGDLNDKNKLVPFVICTNGGNLLEVVKRMQAKYNMSEFIAIKRMNVIVDEDLITPPVVVEKAIFDAAVEE